MPSPLAYSQAEQRVNEPRHAASLARGRQAEQVHSLHIDGDRQALDAFLQRHHELETEQTFQARKRVTTPYTQAVFSQLTHLFSKALTIGGHQLVFHFDDPALEEDFRHYLQHPTNRLEHFWQELHQASFTGFQGLFVVDLPAQENAPDLLPAPYVSYVPSAAVADLDVDTEGTLLYVTLERKTDQGTVRQLVDSHSHRFWLKSRDGWHYQASWEVTHGLGRVPAVPVTQLLARLGDPVERTSPVAAAMPLADTLLRDHSEHELNKLLHAFQEKWSYGVPCDHQGPGGSYCEGGFVHLGEDRVPCAKCQGQGKYIPIGPDRVYLKRTPESAEDVQIGEPAGYIAKDLEPTRYLKECMEAAAASIPKAVFAKEGIVAQASRIDTATGKEIELQGLYDKLRAYTRSLSAATQQVLSLMAQYRYGSAFCSVQVHFNTSYGLKSQAQLEDDFARAKAAGLHDSQLVSYLEELLQVKYQHDPAKLTRHRLLLHLLPFPTLSNAELSQLEQVEEQDRLFQLYLSDRVEQFEIENGPLEQFGSELPWPQRLATLKQALRQAPRTA